MENEIERKYSLIGVNLNAYSVIAYVTKCMREERLLESDILEYRIECKNSNYKRVMRISNDMLNFLNSKYEI